MAEGAGLRGAASGAATGASVGTAINPGWGTAIGAVVGGVAGMVGGLSKQKKAKESQRIAMSDPMEQSRLQRLQQISRSMAVGSDALTQNKIGEVNRLGSQTQNAIIKSSGGDVGATMQGLLQSQRNTQSGINTALVDRSQLPFYENMGQQLRNRMSDRRLQLALLNRAQQTAEYAQGAKEDNVNTMGALGSLALEGYKTYKGTQGGGAGSAPVNS